MDGRDKDNILQVTTSIMKIMLTIMELSDCHNIGMIMFIVTIEMMMMNTVINGVGVDF